MIVESRWEWTQFYYAVRRAHTQLLHRNILIEHTMRGHGAYNELCEPNRIGCLGSRCICHFVVLVLFKSMSAGLGFAHRTANRVNQSSGCSFESRN